MDMKDIAVIAALAAAASLGCVPFVWMFADGQRVRAWEQITTVGVVAFLTAAGQMLARGGLMAAVLLMLLTWFVYDTVRRHALSRRAFIACAWASLARMLSSIGFDHGTGGDHLDDLRPCLLDDEHAVSRPPTYDPWCSRIVRASRMGVRLTPRSLEKFALIKLQLAGMNRDAQLGNRTQESFIGHSAQARF